MPDSGAITEQGHAALRYFLLDPAIIHLNHGSFGAAPRAVLDEQQRWRTRMEENTMRFFLDELPLLLRQRANEAASRFGGDADGWVFVENATAAANAVLNSLSLKEGDVLVTTSHAYGAVLKAVKRRAADAGATVRIVDVHAPVESSDQIVTAIARSLCERTRLLVIDHVTSQSATIFPVQAIVRLAHDKGMPVFVDGAHAIGMLELDMRALATDWYTGNVHKWMFAPKGCAVLWTAPERRAGTHAHVTSHGWGSGYTAEFDWVGTRDPSPWLCFGAAAKAHDEFGGPALMGRNMRLAREAGEYLAGYFNGPRAAPDAMQGAMASLRLASHGTLDQTIALRRALDAQHGIEAALFPFQDELWLRVSAQIYNERSDYERLGEALARLLA